MHYANHFRNNCCEAPRARTFMITGVMAKGSISKLLLSNNSMSQSPPWSTHLVLVPNGKLWFYVILVFAFGINLLCLVDLFLIKRSGFVADFMEPEKTFALAINSPSSEQLDKSRGAGHSWNELKFKCQVIHDEGSGHYLLKDKPKGD